ncbi:DUF2514 family protein [Pseudomonas segetis]|nr:DUF2514 family protein [Pseudomonas segetis]
MSVRNLAIVATLLAVFLSGAWINGARWEANHTAYVADVERRNSIALDQARSEEQRRQTAIEGIRKDAQDKIDAAAIDATVAGATADGLRAELDRIKRARSSCASATNGSQAGADSTAVLTDLLEEVERAGRAMAQEAQRRGNAGRACEKSYDAL